MDKKICLSGEVSKIADNIAYIIVKNPNGQGHACIAIDTTTTFSGATPNESAFRALRTGLTVSVFTQAVEGPCYAKVVIDFDEKNNQSHTRYALECISPNYR